jgi:glycosyltransferase involved in cell wall biosynthesis
MIAEGNSIPLGPRPEISVIMANYNCAQYLNDAIRSVQNQQLQNIEIIVSDDASSDQSVDIVNGLMAKDFRIRLLRNDQNRGPAAARNRAIDVAAGEWIAIMDSDDLMHPQRLAMLKNAAIRDGADLVADNILEFFDDDLRSARRLLKGKWASGPFWMDILDFARLNDPYGSGPALGYLKPLIHASIFTAEKVRYDETLTIAEDYNLVIRLLLAGKTMRVYPIPRYYYRKRRSSISHRLNKNALEAIKRADLELLGQASAKNKRLARTIASRIKSIENAAAYEELLSALKGQQWFQALRVALAWPRASLLLRLPLGVRLRQLRLVRALAKIGQLKIWPESRAINDDDFEIIPDPSGKETE